MPRFTQPLTQLIHESFSVIVTFAFSRLSLRSLRDSRFNGEWKYLDRALFEISQQRAERACLELATFIRLLDDLDSTANYFRVMKGRSFGRVMKKGQADEPLYLRDMTNKIIHAHQLDWDFSVQENPMLICISSQPERWSTAEVEVVALAEFCGQLVV